MFLGLRRHWCLGFWYGMLADLSGKVFMCTVYVETPHTICALCSCWLTCRVSCLCSMCTVRHVETAPYDLCSVLVQHPLQRVRKRQSEQIRRAIRQAIRHRWYVRHRTRMRVRTCRLSIAEESDSSYHLHSNTLRICIQ